jgi:hypothetical protein
MRTLFAMIWGINTVALFCVLASIRWFGGTSARKDMAGDLLEIWAALAAFYMWALLTSKRRAKQERQHVRPSPSRNR